MTDRSLLARARADVGVFAEALIGEPLWPHQLAFARSTARTRVACCGRQSGKSRSMAVMALHAAFADPDRLVLVVSATDDAAKRLLAEMAVLASGPLLSGSVVDESKSMLVLTNGSRVVSVPASERQVRGWTADLLIVDEAAFVAEEVWLGARFTTVATGGRIVLASTPYGRRDRFFSVAYEAGLANLDGFASFHWPSTASPMVSEAVLAEWRPTLTDRAYRSEILAEWVDDAGAYFTAAELELASSALEMVAPGEAQGREAVGGVDWGMSHDANALVVVVVEEYTEGGEPVYRVVWLLERFRLAYSAFIEELVGVAGGYRFVALAAETNGVGAMPSEVLRRRMIEAGRGDVVVPLHTTAQLKELGFGLLKMLAQEGRLVLPPVPALLRQLAALEFEVGESGSLRIAVPDRAGHDDLAMSLCLAATQLAANEMAPVVEQIVTLEDLDDGFEPVRISDF